VARKPKSENPTANSTAPKKRGRKARELPDQANVNPDAIAACFQEYSSLMADSARIGQRIAKTLERFEKSDGVDRRAIKNSYKLAQKDPEVVARELARDKEYAQILDLITTDDGGQITLSDELIPAAPKKLSPKARAGLAAARAHADGYNTGFHGGSLEHNRHEAGTEEHQQWVVGFHDGHAERIKLNPDLANVTTLSASRKRKEPVKTADATVDLEELTSAVRAELDQQATTTH
jgi:ribosome modulation factor